VDSVSDSRPPARKSAEPTETTPRAQSERSEPLVTRRKPAKNPIANTKMRFERAKNTTIWSTFAPSRRYAENVSAAPVSQ